MGAFNDDTYIEMEVRTLCEKYGIQTIVETGTFMGATTSVMAGFAPVVHTIEINPDFFGQVQFEQSNIVRYLGNSPDVMASILNNVAKPCLFYLDAHWYDYWPILDEMKIIGELAKNSVIVIHDCYVPDRPDLGYDSYQGNTLCFEYFSPYLTEIFPSGYSYHYNGEATGEKRGVIYIYP